MQSYSQDLRERVLWALDRGERPSSIARRLEVSRVWVYQVRDRAAEVGQADQFSDRRPSPFTSGRDGISAARLDRS